MVAETVVQLQVVKVHPSLNNYRKTADKGKQDELNASVKQHGVQNPIWVRPDFKHLSEWEIIAGERRYKAAIAAGLTEIPAIVKKATDQEALVLSVLENDQREDVSPMDQALAYQDILNKGKHTPETLSESLSRSPAYIQGRLKLLTLPKEAQKNLLEGKIELGHALLITRIKDPKGQADFLQDILGEYDGTMSVSQARSMLSQYSMRLAHAPFNVKTVCMNCSSRSKSQAVLFSEEAKLADECYDRECFAQKTREHYEAKAKRLQEKGVTVLTAVEDIRKAKNDPLSMEISPEKDREWIHPKKYKTMCAECDKHLYFIAVDGDNHSEGELCLDKKCFNTMNGRAQASASSSSAPSRSRGSGSGAARQHVLFMRDRFLRSTVPAKVAESEVLQQRLAIYHVLCRFEQFGGQGRTDLKMNEDEVFRALMKDICPFLKTAKYGVLKDQELYAAVETIPAKQLSAVLKKVVLASVPHTDEGVLLQITPEAGITLGKNFKVDETYLNTLTKGELIGLERTWKLGGMTPLVNGAIMNKSLIVKTILSCNLVGKVVPAIEKECKLVTLGKKGR